MRHVALLLTTGALLLADEEKPEKPVLVHADAACFIHALRATPDVSGARVERVVRGGSSVIHTVRATGEMTVLVPATGVVAINTRRISFRVTRILGVAADAERIYVLVWTGGTRDRPPEPNALIERGRYQLRAFWLADGTPLKTPALDAVGLPKEAPAGTLEKGPLRLFDGGVECFGTRAAYKGRDLKA